MKILWIVNTIFPELSKKLGLHPPIAGGWMYGLANDLAGNGIELHVATAQPNVDEFTGEINNITYYLLRGKKGRTHYDPSLEHSWKKLVESLKPEIIHIHGTEYAHALPLVKVCPAEKYVISIQGMTSVYTRYYTGGIPTRDILKNYTFRDFIRQDSILQAKRKFRVRGEKIEIPLLKATQHVIGRTQWDRDHVATINPKARYHFCNESLRDEFYQPPHWNLEGCTKYSIFLSQAGYPIKGLHKVLEAVHIVKEHFPDIHIRVARNNITRSDTLEAKLRLGGYGKYILSLLKKYKLKNHISFTGPLTAQEMKQEYINAHIFICPSSIENSPNSLGEAQLLGVPSIASYVGGVADMVEDGKTGIIYRFEEIEMLAQAIMRIFGDSQLAQSLSANGAHAAAERHDRDTNANQLISIYKTM